MEQIKKNHYVKIFSFSLFATFIIFAGSAIGLTNAHGDYIHNCKYYSFEEVPTLELNPFREPRIEDKYGNTLKNASVNQQMQISAVLGFLHHYEGKSYTILYQIQDSNGVVHYLNWITSYFIEDKFSSKHTVLWTPFVPGEYHATVFVWDSIDTGFPFCTPRSTYNVTVG